MTKGSFFVAAALLAVAAAAWFVLRTAAPNAEETLEQARHALQKEDFERAEQLAREILAAKPESGPALLIAGEAATKRRRYKDALDYYARIPKDGSSDACLGLWASGELLVHLGRLSEAEEKLRHALRDNPQYARARRRLAFLLVIEGRRWESLPHLFELVRQRRFRMETLLRLGDVERLIDVTSHLKKSRKSAPEDSGPLIGLARLALETGRREQAERRLREVIAADPLQCEAQAQLGRILAEDAPDREFLRWHRALPRSCNEHPELWIARGRRAEVKQQLRPAARCYWEALSREPNYRTANYRLGQVLEALGRPERAAPFLERAALLDGLSRVLNELFAERNDLRTMRRAAELTEALGRPWEAWAWASLAQQRNSRLAWARRMTARLQSRLQEDTPRTLPESNPARRIDLSSFPLPAWETEAMATSEEQNGPVQQGEAVRFADLAEEAGLAFTYFNAADPSTEGARIIETTGGGVAALDYDRDGLPDVYFTQGREWPSQSGSLRYRDRFYRNDGGIRFREVTEAAGISGEGFGQGVTAGDFNNDGFPDLYAGNLGGNRLYRNNGDGTFTDVTEAAGIGGEQWTTSCVIADLNGDALPEIYEVNYVSGSDVAHLICEKEGRPHACKPQVFDAAADRLWLNLGDGRFQDVTEAAGVDVPDGYGLGIVAADFNQSGLLDLFVANDQTANFFFVNRGERSGNAPVFTERAFASGLAADGDGRVQACMGIAAGDADGDGHTDLFVTNFSNESNTLYRQQAGPLFVDATRRAGLRAASFALLGFGTQFLDGDLDGRLDLVLTNGHIEDRTRFGGAYPMRPQYFRNVGGGEFVEAPAESLGPFFQRKFLGRGLARLDWNGDGQDDFVVSHIGSPAALVTNRTERTGHFLAVRLCGTVSGRDAVGSTVRVTAGGTTWCRQLTAGDGYQACNQRQLVFGLGDCREVENVAVRWPSGQEQTFADPPVDTCAVLIEGRRDALVLMPHQGK